MADEQTAPETAPTWTTAQPTAEGFYWCRDDKYVYAVWMGPRVTRFVPPETRWCGPGLVSVRPPTSSGERKWFGPINPPA